MGSEQAQTPLCRQCKHFFVTWEQNMPNGCRVYGFKCKSLPTVLVKESTGHECDAFEKKTTPGEQKGDSYDDDKYW